MLVKPNLTLGFRRVCDSHAESLTSCHRRPRSTSGHQTCWDSRSSSLPGVDANVSHQNPTHTKLTYIHARTHACAHLHIHARTHTYVHAYTRARHAHYTHTCTHTRCTHKHTHTHTHWRNNILLLCFWLVVSEAA